MQEDRVDPLRSYYMLNRDLEPHEVPEGDFEPGYHVAPLNDNARELYLFRHKVPISEVYLGARSTYEEDPEFAELFQPGRKVFKLDVNQSSWSFEQRKLFSQ